MDRNLVFTRLALGVLLVLGSINYFAGELLSLPEGSNSLSIQLVEAVRFSGLLDVVMGIQLVAGLLILAGPLLPVALAAVMPISICALFWAMLLEGSIPWSLYALVVVALGALLMFALLPVYSAMLAPYPLAAGEDDEGRYERRFSWPVGGIAPREWIIGMAIIGGVTAFYHYLVPSMLAFYCISVLIYPAIIATGRLIQGVAARRVR